MTFPDTALDRRAWEMTEGYMGTLRNRIAIAQNIKNRLKGVQLKFGGGALAYRCTWADGSSLVLCDRHLDLRRGAGETLKLTGESFEAALCDDCEEHNDTK
jgi:hypothetical protein